MTPAELESHIVECGERMKASMAMYSISSAFSDRGDADFWRISMEHAIRARTPETVARMEEERGLTNA